MKKTFSVFWAGCFAVCSFVNFDIASALSDFPATSETAAIPEVSGPSAEIVHQNGRIDSLPTAVPTIQRLNLPEEDWLQISTVRKHADVKAALSAEANKDKITALIFNNCGNMTDDDTPKLNMSYQTMLEDFGLQPELAKIFPITTLSNLVDLKQFPNLKSIHIYSCNEWNTHNVKFLCEIWVFIYITFTNFNVWIFLCHLCNYRAKHLARATPGCPEIYDNWFCTF